MKNFTKKNPLPVIIFTVFIDMLGFGILIPIIPLLLTDPRSEFFLLPRGAVISQGYLILGLLTAVYPLMQFIAAPILGQLSDVKGRKKILFLSIMGTSIAYFVFALGIMLRSIPLLFISRAVDGITGGNISVAQAAIADITEPKNRAKTFGLIGAAFGLGFILGPYLGGKLSDPHTLPFLNATSPFIFAGILSFINLISIYFNLPETNLYRRNKPVRLDQSVTNIKKAFGFKDLRIIFLTTFLVTSGFTFFTTFFGVYLIKKFHFDQGDIGDFFAYIGIWSIITQGLIIRRIAGKVSEDRVLRVTLFGLAICILLYYLPHVWWQLFLIVPFFAIFNGLSNVNLTALLSRSAGVKVQGEILGLNSSIIALAQIFPPVISGIIAAKINPTAPIGIAALTMFLAAFVYVSGYKPRLNFE